MPEYEGKVTPLISQRDGVVEHRPADLSFASLGVRLFCWISGPTAASTACTSYRISRSSTPTSWYYCESEKESLCYFKEAVVSVPVKVKKGAGSRALTATYRLQLANDR
jgi:hypothetical protein